MKLASVVHAQPFFVFLFCCVLSAILGTQLPANPYYRDGNPAESRPHRLSFPEIDEDGNLIARVVAPLGDIYRLMGLSEEGQWIFLKHIDQLDATEEEVILDLGVLSQSGIRCIRVENLCGSEDARKRFDFFRKKWAENRPDRYSMVQERNAAFYAEDHLLEVEGSEIVSVIELNNGMQAPESSWNYRSVDGLFELIEGRLDQCLDIKYDRALGYPVWIDTTDWQWSIDLGFSFVTRLGLESIDLTFNPDIEAFSTPFEIVDVALWQIENQDARLYFSYLAYYCSSRDFQLWTNGTFSNSEPPAIDAFVSLKGDGTCLPEGTRSLAREYVNIQNLVDLYENTYGEEGPFLINLQAITPGVDAIEGRSVLYVPDLAEAKTIRNLGEVPDGISEDEFVVVNASLVPGIQNLDVEFRAPGVCQKGEFDLFCPLIFKNTYPPEVDLFLRYDRGGEECFGEEYGRVVFEMDSVFSAFQEFTGEQSQIVINLHTVIDGMSRSVRKLAYQSEKTKPASVSSLDQVPNGFAEAAFEFRFGSLNSWDSELLIAVEFDGGCEEHAFHLSSDFVFKESNPVQIDVLLRHDANEDICGERRTELLRFDFAAAMSEFKGKYGDGASLEINVISVVDGVESTIGSVVYEP